MRPPPAQRDDVDRRLARPDALLDAPEARQAVLVVAVGEEHHHLVGEVVPVQRQRPRDGVEHRRAAGRGGQRVDGRQQGVGVPFLPAQHEELIVEGDDAEAAASGQRADEAPGGAFQPPRHRRHAGAEVDGEHQVEGHVNRLEELDLLPGAVLVEREVVAGEAIDESAAAVAHDDRDEDDVGLDGEEQRGPVAGADAANEPPAAAARDRPDHPRPHARPRVPEAGEVGRRRHAGGHAVDEELDRLDVAGARHLRAQPHAVDQEPIVAGLHDREGGRRLLGRRRRGGRPG